MWKIHFQDFQRPDYLYTWKQTNCHLCDIFLFTWKKCVKNAHICFLISSNVWSILWQNVYFWAFSLFIDFNKTKCSFCAYFTTLRKKCVRNTQFSLLRSLYMCSISSQHVLEHHENINLKCNIFFCAILKNLIIFSYIITSSN